MNISFPVLSDERYQVALRGQVAIRLAGRIRAHVSKTCLYVVIERRPRFPFLPAFQKADWFIEVRLTGDDADDEARVNAALLEAAQRFEDGLSARSQAKSAAVAKRKVLAQAYRR